MELDGFVYSLSRLQGYIWAYRSLANMTCTSGEQRRKGRVQFETPNR